MTVLQSDPGPERRVTLTIASGEHVSGVMSVSNVRPRGLAVLVPHAWTAADLLIAVSPDNSTWHLLEDRNGGLVRLTGINTATPLTSVTGVTISGGVYTLSSDTWAVGTFPFMRFISISVGGTTAVNQGAARSITVVALN